jgi:hypothetical protein
MYCIYIHINIYIYIYVATYILYMYVCVYTIRTICMYVQRIILPSRMVCMISHVMYVENTITDVVHYVCVCV